MLTRRTSQPVIMVNLIGGLGNQMFQYAAGRSLAYNHNAPLLLDTSGFEDYPLRRYELNDFNIQARPASQAELQSFDVRSRSGSGLISKLWNRLGCISSGIRLQEASFAYDERVTKVFPPVYLNGYWQSEQYFSDIALPLRKEFTLKSKWDSTNEDMHNQILSAGSSAISLHIRRGDYVSNPHTAQYHGVCSLEYYRTAVSYVAERVSQPHFFIFSDDHEWVREHFDLGYPITLVQVNDPDNGINDMMLMKSCRHHIIANSSFSWWGAWLNPSLDKIVIAPAKWFAKVDIDTRDLIPTSWVKL